ncbi:MAG TPA: MFS transporter [Actinomycetes bacterium]
MATAVGSTGLSAGGTAGTLIAVDLTGSAALAGVPLGLLVVGSAAGAVLISRRSQQAGRVAGLRWGYALGALGAAIVVVGTAVGSFGLVLAGSLALGVANAAVFLSRYAAAEVGGGAVRGRALGLVLGSAAVGAVASPNLLGPSGHLASWLGLPRLAGLHLVAVPSFLIAGALLAALPSRSAVGQADRPRSPTGTWIRDAIKGTRVRLALVVLAATNLVMVATMAVAPAHLEAHGYSLGGIGLVVSVHVLGMFAPSPLTGWLADRAGGGVVAGVGAVLLVGAGFGGAIAGAHDGPAFTAVLVLLGIGWNAGVVGGSTMLVASVPPAVRQNAEGIGEVAMGLAAGAGAPIAGLMVAAGGLPTLSVASAAVSVLVFTVLSIVPTRSAASRPLA